jgi:hypothetical protein
MTASKFLPARPSLDSLRKQAKKLARDHSLTVRDAQLALARAYGFAGWQDLTAEVSKRLGNDLEWAAAQARRVIHDNDVERLKQLIAEHPALLFWHGDDDDGGLLGFATGAYGDAGDAQREQKFTRAACAELLIDAGAVVMPSVFEGILQSRARGLLELFRRKGQLPRTLNFFAALGDFDAVRSALRENTNDPTSVNEAFIHSCRFQHEAIASLLLDRSITLDAELGSHVDRGPGRSAFVQHFIANKPDFVDVAETGLWRGFVMERIGRALHDGDLTSFVDGLRREAWTLSDTCVTFQVRLIEVATLNGRGEFITALLDLDPAILRQQPPPPSQAIEFAFTYAKTNLLTMLLRIWPLPDDLPHAAGNGDLARVRRWFDAEGKPALGDVANHAPATSVHPREPQWGEVGVQQVLDTALAWSVINHHFDVGDYLLGHGADINTNWNSHEPASILHTLVFEDDYEAMQYLIDRGIDMTIEDYRWNSTAYGWALYGKNDPRMAQWLEDAERQRVPPATSS